ncbi:MAG: hypothetical protein ACP5N7_06055 [Candidatus Pacearchaeota archaeon]
MAWIKTSKGLNVNQELAVMTETVALGGTAATRYSSAFSVPRNVKGFTVISNTAATNTSGSLSDHLYVSVDNSTFVKVSTLRDCNYRDDVNQGTSFKTLDTTVRPRYVDLSYVGKYPYYKIGLTHAAVESTGKTIGLAIIFGEVDHGKLI